MELISDILKANMIWVFFVYGLTYFAMGLAVALESGRQSKLNLATSLPFLAAYALTHGAVEWSDMFLLISGASLGSTVMLVVRAVQQILLVLSAIFLLIFGVRLLLSTWQRHRWLARVPPALVTLWIVAAGTGWLAGSRELETWLTDVDASARHLLYFPGGILAGVGLAAQRSDGSNSSRRSMDLAYICAGVAFGINGLVAGLVVPSTGILPFSLTYDDFMAITGFPVQVLRACVGAAIAFFVLRVLRIFDLEYRQELERMSSERIRLYNELQRKEELRTRLLEKVITAQEEERKRIARELHDEASQALSALIISLESAEQALPTRIDEMRARLSSIKGLTLQTLEDIRKLIIDLRPTLLDDLGLIPALRWYTNSHVDRTGIELNFAADGFDERLPAQIETALFRVVQEAMNNIVKHSQASHGNIKLELRDSVITIIIEDNGKGFDVGRMFVPVSKGRGLGLLGMKERMSLLGGNLAIESEPGAGTRILANLPLYAFAPGERNGHNGEKRSN
ncbi:MAG: sensor histidine kinase [Chloroflexi bacterium]|nr:sensor histidine kinase [Chloroflexota bacterium]